MLTGVIGVDLNWKKLTRKKNIWEHHMAATHVEKILEVIYQLSTFTRVLGLTLPVHSQRTFIGHASLKLEHRLCSA